MGGEKGDGGREGADFGCALWPVGSSSSMGSRQKLVKEVISLLLTWPTPRDLVFRLEKYVQASTATRRCAMQSHSIVPIRRGRASSIFGYIQPFNPRAGELKCRAYSDTS